MRELRYVGNDLRWLFEALIEACEITSREGDRPAIVVNGQRYEPFDLLKVAALLPDEPLQPHHQLAADELFKKQQHGYRRTAFNLAHRANQVSANAGLRKHLQDRGGPFPDG